MNHTPTGKKKDTKVDGLNLKCLNQSGNILIDEKKGYCWVKLNPKIHPLEAVQFATHHLSGEANIVIDLDNKGLIQIEIFLKEESQSIKDIFWKFNESVIGYSVYLIQSERNKKLREAIVKRALSMD